MAKQEFLEMLRLALNGKLESGAITENIRFYEEYINTEIRKGKSEEEVLAALGDPRLIAKTIIQTKSRNNDYGSGNGRQAAGYDRKPLHDDRRMKHLYFLLRIPGWVWLIVFIVILVVVLSVVFSVIKAILPVLLPILLVLFLVKLFRDWIS